MGKWSSVKIESIAAKSKASIAIGPFGSRMKADCYVPEGVPVVRGTNISGGRSFRKELVFITEDKADELRSSNIFAGDLVFPHRGAIGEVGIVPDDAIDRYVLSSSLMKLTVDAEKAHPLFVFYFFRSRLGRHELLKNASQVGTPGIATPLTSLKAIDIPLPPLPEQRAIASVLGALDDKIELNRRMNKTLEDMAAAIFKAWFVDFEPVRAKASGAASFAGMPQEVFDSLPSGFVDSELGEIPEGWEVKPIGDVVEIKGGGTPSTKNNEYWDGGVHPWVTPRDLSKLTDPILLDTSRFLTDSGLSKVSSGLLPVGTVLLSSRAPIGYLVITAISTAINQGFIAMLPNGEVGAEYLLNWAFANMDDIKGRANGTTFQEVSKKSFRPMPILVPDAMTEEAFAQAAKKYYQQLQLNMEETQSLTEIRDTLLPKLLSGEVRVSESNTSEVSL